MLRPRERLLVLRDRVDFRAVDLRAALGFAFANAVFARVVVAFFAALARELVELLAVARFAVERFAVERFAVERFAVERLAVERLRVVDLRAAVRARPPVLPPVPSSTVHLPDITRCAASATASAISEPNLVALAIMLVAACDAVSAASSPASRIARRTLGLALIAAAAAANPAASISLLIAALASLSTVSLPDEVVEVLLRADLAIA